MTIPENVSEVTFLYSGWDTDFAQGDFEEMLDLLNISASVDEYLTEFDPETGYGNLYINFYPKADADLFAISEALAKALVQMGFRL